MGSPNIVYIVMSVSSICVGGGWGRYRGGPIEVRMGDFLHELVLPLLLTMLPLFLLPLLFGAYKQAEIHLYSRAILP